MHIWRVLILLFAMGPSIYAADLPQARPQLNFEISVNPDSELGKTLVAAMTASVAKLGYDFQYTYYPPQRGLQQLKVGRIDGSMGRIGDLTSFLDTQKLERINVPIVVFTFSRWCRKDVSASQTKIHTGSRLGTMAMKMLTPQLAREVELQELNDLKAGLMMLKFNRLDCFLSVEDALEAEGITADDLKEFARFDLVSFQVFPWLSSQHQALKPAIEAGLNGYAFPEWFRKKHQNPRGACENSLNVLCPDGILFRKKVKFY